MGDKKDAQKLLDKYILNYLIKKNMPASAELFAKEANISSETLEFDCPEGDLTTLFSSMSSTLQSYVDAARPSTSTANGNVPQPNLNVVARNAGPELQLLELHESLQISPTRATQNPTLPYHQSPTMLASSINPRSSSEAPIVPDEPDVTQLDSEPSASGSSTSDQSEQTVSDQN